MTRLDTVLAITTDNVSSNGTFIDELVRMTKQGKNPFKKENWIHCFGHVLYLSVNDALKFIEPNIKKVPDWIIQIHFLAQQTLWTSLI